MVLGTWIPLLAVPVALGLLTWLVRSKDWFPGRRQRVLLTYGLATTAILFALCDPAAEVRWGGLPTVIVIADASPSMRHGLPWPEAALWVRRELPHTAQMGLVSFSGTSQVAVTPSGRLPTALALGRATVTGPATNIEQAIRSAMALADRPTRTALLLYSDGYETEGRAMEAAAEAAERGFRLFCLPPAKPAAPPNAALADLRYPDGLRPGQEGKVRAAVRSNRDGAADVALFLRPDDAQAAPDLQSVQLRVGVTHWVEFPVKFDEPGYRPLKVTVRGPADDAVPEDNDWAFGIQVGDRKPVLVATYRPEGPREARPALTVPSDQPTDVVDAAQMPVDASALGNYSAVILYDVPAYALSARALDALVTYVRDMGGGLVTLGGGHSFGLGGYARSVLDDMLPVKSDPEDRPPAQIVVALDRSASMGRASGENGGREKLALAKEAVLRISTLLGDTDRVGLVAFNHGTAIAAEQVDTDHWEELRLALRDLRATGGTRIGPAIDTALNMLEGTPEKTPDGKPVRRHIIAVSDGIVVGEDRKPPFEVAAMALRARRLKTTISLVLTGETDAWPGLRDLAELTGGRFYDISAGLISPTGRNRLSRILLEDLELPLLEKEPAAVTMGARRPIWRREEPLRRFAAVPRHVVTEAKKRAAVHLAAGEKARPLLATWAYGLGRAVAWPVPWQKETLPWLTRREVAEAFTSSLTWAARGPVAEADYDVAISVAGGQLCARVEQRRLPDRLAPVPPMRLTLAGRRTDKPISLDLAPAGPGVWTLERSISAGAYACLLTAGSDDERLPVYRCTLSTGPSLEYRRLDNSERFLGRLADIGGGRVLDSPSDVAAMAVPATRRTPLWPYLLALAGLLLVYESLHDLLSRRG